MNRLTYSAPPVSVFVPTITAEITTTGREAWRTDVRRPPFYGVFGVISRPMPPNNIGVSTLQRYKLMQPSNPQGVYVSIDKEGQQ